MRHVRTWGAGWSWMAASLLAASGLLASCRATRHPPGPTATSEDKAGPGTSALAELRHKAAVQQESPEHLPGLAPAPPGVDANAVDAPPGTDLGEQSQARMDLAAALRVIVRPLAPEDGPPPSPEAPGENVDAQQARVEALSAYAKARELMLDGKSADATTLLQQAARLDPSSGAVWRELGEAQLSLNRRGPGVAALKQAVRLGAGGAGVLTRLAQESRRAGRTEEGVAYLARARDAHPEGEDPVLSCVINAALGESLASMGYWRAGRDCLGDAMDFEGWFGDSIRWRQEYADVYRRRGDFWIQIGDLSSRLGEYGVAAEAYERASEVPLSDPGAPFPRLTLALVRAGRPAEAALRLVDSISQSPERADDRHAALVRYLSERASLGPDLAAALGEVREHLRRTSTPSVMSRLARVEAAALTPPKARATLRESLLARPRDAETAAALLEGFGPGEDKARADELERLVEARPSVTANLSEGLVRVGRGVRATLDALTPRTSAAAGLARAGTLRRLGRFEDGAKILEQLPDPSRADAALRAQWLALRAMTELDLARGARAEQSAALLETINVGADPALALCRARALLAAGRPSATAEMPEAASAADLLESARISIDAGQALQGERLAQRARAMDPFEEGSYEVLLSLYANAGPMPDSGKFLETARQLRQAMPTGRWLRVLAAREMVERSSLANAEPVLMELAALSPPDNRAVELLGQLAQREGAAGAMRERILAVLAPMHEQRPESPVVAMALARAQAANGKAESAVDLLSTASQAAPLDEIERLREAIVRDVLKRPEEAEAMAVARLRAAPPTLAHALELAQVHVRRGEVDQAAQLVAERLPVGAVPTREQSQAVLEILGKLPTEPTSPESARSACDLMDAVEARGVAISAPLAVKRLKYACVGRAGEPGPLYELAVRTGRQVKDLGDGAFDLVLGQLTKSKTPRDSIGFAEQLATREHPFKPVYGRVWLVLAGEYGTLDDVKRVLAGLDTDERINGALEGLERAPGDASARSRAAYVASNFMIARGREDEGMGTLRHAVELDASNHIACNDLGYMLLERDRSHDEAAKLIESAFSGLSEDANVVDSLGWLRYKQGAIEDAATVPGQPENLGAVSLLRRAIDLSEDQPNETSLDHLGDALWRSGKNDDAVKAWKQAHSLASIELEQRRSEAPESPQTKRIEQHMASLKGKLDAVTAGERPLIATTWADK